MYERPIHISLSPNLTWGDTFRSLKLLCTPWTWREGADASRVESWFKEHFPDREAFSFNAGRSALLAILSAFALPKGSEVLLQAFTCVAVPNSVSWAGFTPVFVDVDETLNIDVTDAAKKITPRSRVLLVQHTFGVPAKMEKITQFCRRYNLILIEDCAHALGATYRGKLLGTFGEAAFFSFGRDKVVSSVFGGVALVRRDEKRVAESLHQFHRNIPYPAYFWICRQLLHPVISKISLQLYQVAGAGKFLLWFAQKLQLISLPVHHQECEGKKPPDYPKKYPNALAALLLEQLIRLEKVNSHRQEIAARYFSRLSHTGLQFPKRVTGAIYLRFNVLTPRADEIRYHAKKAGMILGKWYHQLIDPVSGDISVIGYRYGSCPQAEKAARSSLNLPTYFSLTRQQADRIVRFINKFHEG